MSGWSMDRVLHERLRPWVERKGVTHGDWMTEALREGRAAHGWNAHASTMGDAPGFEVIDEPCAIPVRLRFSIDVAERALHVRQMPITPHLTYVNYGYDDDQAHDEDEERIWNRPVLVCLNLSPPETVCTVMAGMRLGDAVETGIRVLDDAIVDCASVEPTHIVSRLHQGSRREDVEAALVVRLRPMRPVTVEVPSHDLDAFRR